MYLVTSEQMQALDRHTLTSLQVPGLVLMDHAGKAVAAEVAAREPNRVVLLCGKGNNGGDGWIAARWLKHWGVREVMVMTTTALDDLQGDANQAARMAVAAGIPYEVYQFGTSLPIADVYVDALLGTGTTRPLSGLMREMVESLNQVGAYTVAVDVPTGVDASTGVVQGTAVRAHATVCMGLQKLGTAVSPGCHYAGDVTVADLGIFVPDHPNCAQWVTPNTVCQALPARPAESHKGSFGRVGIAVGRMGGAAVLAGWGAARVGTGLVALVCASAPSCLVPPEFVVREAEFGLIQPHLADCSTVVVGPGLGDQVDAWADAVRNHQGMGVLDADGLRLLDGGRQLPEGKWVITPHPKECARLLGWTTEDVQQRRLEAATTLADRTNAVVVLKGFHSLIASPDGQLYVNPTGNSALATAGTGDVLAGMVAGLLAQGVDPLHAAASAVWLHGKAGELAGAELSTTSTMASDVVDNISRAILLCFDTRSR